MFRLTTIAAALAITLISFGTTSLSAATYEIDNVHTNVLWKVQHLGTSMMYGRFNDISGTLNYDGTAPTDVSITIKTASIDSGTEQLDKHLRAGDFFDSSQYPKMTFTSTEIVEAESGWTVNGDLTIRGVTKSVSLVMVYTGMIEDHPKFGTRVGFHGSFTINRSDYGVSYGVDSGAVGDEVELIVSVEAIKK